MLVQRMQVLPPVSSGLFLRQHGCMPMTRPCLHGCAAVSQQLPEPIQLNGKTKLLEADFLPQLGKVTAQTKQVKAGIGERRGHTIRRESLGGSTKLCGSAVAGMALSSRCFFCRLENAMAAWERMWARSCISSHRRSLSRRRSSSSSWAATGRLGTQPAGQQVGGVSSPYTFCPAVSSPRPVRAPAAPPAASPPFAPPESGPSKAQAGHVTEAVRKSLSWAYAPPTHPMPSHAEIRSYHSSLPLFSSITPCSPISVKLVRSDFAMLLSGRLLPVLPLLQQVGNALSPATLTCFMSCARLVSDITSFPSSPRSGSESPAKLLWAAALDGDTCPSTCAASSGQRRSKGSRALSRTEARRGEEAERLKACCMQMAACGRRGLTSMHGTWQTWRDALDSEEGNGR